MVWRVHRTGGRCRGRCVHLDELDDVGEELGDAGDGVGREHAQRRHVAEEFALEAPRHGGCPFHARPPVRGSSRNDFVVDVGHAHDLWRGIYQAGCQPASSYDIEKLCE